MGKREVLGKSVITTQQQTLSMTHIQLFNNVDKKFSVKLETLKGVHCGDIEIESGKWWPSMRPVNRISPLCRTIETFVTPCEPFTMEYRIGTDIAP